MNKKIYGLIVSLLVICLVFSYIPSGLNGFNILVTLQSPTILDSKISNESNIVSLNTNGSIYIYTAIDGGGVNLGGSSFNALINVSNSNHYKTIISGYSRESFGRFNNNNAAYYGIGGIAVGNSSGLDLSYTISSKYFFTNSTSSTSFEDCGGSFQVNSSGSLVIVVLASSNSYNVSLNSSFAVKKINELNMKNFVIYQGYSLLSSGTYSIKAIFNCTNTNPYATDAFVGIYMFTNAHFSRTYPVSFTESGLPSGSNWFINLSSGQGFYSNTSRIYFSEVNGTYVYYASNSTVYIPSPGKGNMTVSGSGLNFTIKYGKGYNVNFVESGLPYGTLWFVNLTSGESFSSKTNTISLMEGNGTYNYSVATVNKEYSANNSSGSFSVNGKEINVTITFYLVSYKITFTENGLPSGTGWYINLSNSQSFTSTNSSMIFSEPNGTYSYTAATSNGNYVPSPSSGTFNVNGKPINLTVSFLMIYNVKFNEYGLSSGSKWYVNITGISNQSSTGRNLTFSLKNGSYNYTTGTFNKSYRPLNSTSRFTVSGSNVVLNITFVPVFYRITFTENGLPYGGRWFINISNGEKFNSTGNNITFYEMNGTYSYTISSNLNYSTEPSYGTLNVNGRDLYFNVSFKRSYSIKFNELNLISGVLWGVNINGTNVKMVYMNRSTSSGGSIGCNLWNGSYQITIIGTPVWYNNTILTLDINGSGKYIVVRFSWNSSASALQNNTLTFPPGGMVYFYAASTGGSWPVKNPNYTVDCIANSYWSGGVVKIGHSNSNTGSFSTGASYYSIGGIRIPYSKNYTNYQIFQYSGQPGSGTVVGSFSLSSYGLIVLVSGAADMENGTVTSTVPFRVDSRTVGGGSGILIATAWAGPGYYSATVNYSGPSTDYNVVGFCIYVFYMEYNVTFSENGLPPGTKWFVNLSNGQSFFSEGKNISFTEPNGTYSYHIYTVDKNFAPFPQSGKINVNGSGVNVKISFNPFDYNITFTEGGLLPGTIWYVNLSNGQTFSSKNSMIIFGEQNGSYSYTISTLNKDYMPEPPSGTFTVNGKVVNINITFNLLTYTVTFKENGLPSGVTWFVNLTNGQTFSSTTSTINFLEPNGTYSYTISTVKKNYAASPYSGTFKVNGANLNLLITFNIQTYTVKFIENGLPSGTTWYVNLSNGQSYSGTGGTIAFSEQNGTYHFSIATVNKSYAPYPSSGTFSVSDSSVNVSIMFNLQTYTVIFMENGLTPGTSWSVILGGLTKTSNTSSITFNEPNGTYSYEIISISGYEANPSSGSLIVNGNSLNENISWNVLKYPIIIVLNGIPNGTTWSVTLSGLTFNGQNINVTLSSTTNSIEFYEPNGSYDYILHLPSGYLSKNNSGNISLYGKSLMETIAVQHSKSSSTLFMYGFIGAFTVFAVAISLFIFMKKRKQK
ncbi:MAG: hypothetical protein ACP5RL_06440 [Thermoplasmata archaeon]